MSYPGLNRLPRGKGTEHRFFPSEAALKVIPRTVV